MGQLVGTLVEFSIAQPLVFKDQRDGFRCVLRLPPEQFVYAPSRLVLRLGVVPPEQDLLPLGLGEEPQPRDLLVRV